MYEPSGNELLASRFSQSYSIVQDDTAQYSYSMAQETQFVLKTVSNVDTKK